MSENVIISEKKNAISWDEYFMTMTQLVASKSKDRSTKVGSVLTNKHHSVLGIGYNGFPRGVNDDIEERHERPLKYLITEHSERNCIYNAAFNGIRTEGTILYISGHGTPCADCARAIIQSGISEVVTFKGKFEGTGSLWEESCKVGAEMLKESNVKMTFLNASYIRLC